MICTGPVSLLFFFKKKLSRRELPVPVKCCTHHDADSFVHQLKGLEFSGVLTKSKIRKSVFSQQILDFHLQ
jgi:hypothetical protein